MNIRLDRSGSARVIRYQRSATNVATSGGIIGVMPAGVFRPSSVRVGDHGGDFDLWRNIMREYSEEFLANPNTQATAPAPTTPKNPCDPSTSPAAKATSAPLSCAQPSAASTSEPD